MNEDKASRYHRLRRRASMVGAGAGAVLLAGLLASGGSASLRDTAVSAAGGSFAGATMVYCLLLALASEALQAPISFYQQLALERRYGLSTQPTSKWIADHVKGAVVAFVLGSGAALIVMTLLRWSPDHWWLAAAGCCALLLVGLAQLGPVVLMPLFYTVKPLARAALAARLAALAERAGTPVIGAFEWCVSDRTRKANAALAGLGRTRRILVSDTLLSEHSDDEIAVILAHELAHHRYRDIWAALAVEAILLTVAFFVADRALTSLAGPLDLRGKDDLAGLPVLLLAGGVVSAAARPLVHALSRLHERRADRFALELTGDVEAFVTAMKRLGAQNLAEEHPSRLVELLFHTHPPTAARIAAAQAWARTRPHAARS